MHLVNVVGDCFDYNHRDPGNCHASLEDCPMSLEETAITIDFLYDFLLLF